MGDQNPDDDDTDATDADEGRTLTGKTAYRMHVKEGKTQPEIAQMFSVTQQHVSKLKNDYEDALEEGKSQADPSDFAEDDLRAALGDEEPVDNPFDSVDCPRCGKAIIKSEAPKSAGVHDCPHCNRSIEWGENEVAQ